jgi:hypothetical protein
MWLMSMRFQTIWLLLLTRISQRKFSFEKSEYWK